MIKLNKNISFINNEDGSIIVMTILIMLLLTIIGLGSLNTSSTDIQISRNYKVQKENLVLARASINKAMGEIFKETEESDITDIGYVETKSDHSSYFNTDFKVKKNDDGMKTIKSDWGDKFQIGQHTDKDDKVIPGYEDTEFVVFGDFSPTDYQDYEYIIIVKSEKNGGKVWVEAKFKYEE